MRFVHSTPQGKGRARSWVPHWTCPRSHGPSNAAGTTATPSPRRYASGPVVTTTASSNSSPISPASHFRRRRSRSPTVRASLTSIATTRPFPTLDHKVDRPLAGEGTHVADRRLSRLRVHADRQRHQRFEQRTERRAAARDQRPELFAAGFGRQQPGRVGGRDRPLGGIVQRMDRGRSPRRGRGLANALRPRSRSPAARAAARRARRPRSGVDRRAIASISQPPGRRCNRSPVRSRP